MTSSVSSDSFRLVFNENGLDIGTMIDSHHTIGFKTWLDPLTTYLIKKNETQILISLRHTCKPLCKERRR
jgi:hypothetical protein